MQNYKILFSYLKLWQSCATLSAICWWIFLHFTIKQQIIVISLQQYDQSPQNLVQWCRTYLWCAQPPSWYLLWCRTGLSGVSAVCYLGFYKLNFSWQVHLRDMFRIIIPNFVQTVIWLQRYRNFCIFLVNCENSIDDSTKYHIIVKGNRIKFV